MYDGECLAKAEELGKPGLVTIKQKQVQTGFHHSAGLVHHSRMRMPSRPAVAPDTVAESIPCTKPPDAM